MIDKMFLDKSCAIIYTAGEYLMQEQQKLRPGMVETKALNSLVTYVDKNTEEQLVANLNALLPGSVFLTEEATIVSREGAWQWIIDPLDGTTNYIHGLPVYCISVALKHEDVIVLGIVHSPVLRETFTAIKGLGAYLNGDPIQISGNVHLADCLLSTGFPYYDFDRMDHYIAALRQLMENTRGIRRMGSAAIDLCYTACGRYDGFFEYSLSPWDVAAGGLIVMEAGGKVCDFSGNSNWLYGREICAGNAAITSALLSRLGLKY